MSTTNYFSLLAEQHHILTNNGPYNRTAQCSTPLADKHTLSALESHADCVCTDVTNSLQALGQLVSSYPSDIGDEDVLLPQIGALLRLLGEVLEYGRDTERAAGDRIWMHECINATTAPAKQEVTA